ncbi:MAG: hypothetical protein QM651_07575, partial [Rhodoblastus sp.]
HSLGKGEVESSILSRSTMQYFDFELFPFAVQPLAQRHVAFVGRGVGDAGRDLSIVRRCRSLRTPKRRRKASVLATGRLNPYDIERF